MEKETVLVFLMTAITVFVFGVFYKSIKVINENKKKQKTEKHKTDKEKQGKPNQKTETKRRPR